MEEVNCKRHEEKINNIEHKMEKLFDIAESNKDSIHKVELKIAEQQSDVTHIKSRIDNGLSKTVTDMYRMVNEMSMKVKEAEDWKAKSQQAWMWIASIGVGGGIAGILFYFIRMVLEKK